MSEELFLEDDFLDAEIDLTDLQIETTQSNPYLSQNLIDIAVSYLKEIRDSYIRLLGYNKAVAKAISSQIKTTSARTKQKYANTKSNNSNEVYRNSRDILQIKLNTIYSDFETEKEYNKSGITFTSKITPAYISSITDSIPDEFGKSIYSLLRSKILTKYSDELMAPLSYEERKEVADCLETILYHLDGDTDEVDSLKEESVIITDVTALQDDRNVQEELDVKFGITQYDLRKKVKAVNELILLLSDSNALESAATPDVYKIDNIAEYINKSTGDRSTSISGSLYMSNSREITPNVEMTLTTGFNTRIHLIGVCKFAVDKRGTLNLIDSMNNEVAFLAAEEGIQDYTKPEDDNIIEIPYCFIGKHSLGKPYVIIGAMDTPFSVRYFKEFIFNERPIISYVKDLSQKRATLDKDAAWSISISASPQISDQLIPEYVVGDDLEESTRFTEEQLYKIVKSKNLKEYLSNYYSGSADSDFAAANKETISAFMSADERAISRYKHLINELMMIPEDKIKLGFSGNYTPNRSVLTQSMLDYFKKPLVHRLEVEQMYNSHKEELIKKVMDSFLTKIEYTRDSINSLLGGTADNDEFFDYIRNLDYSKDKKFKVELSASDIFDTFWFMLRIHEAGYDIQSFRTDVFERKGITVTKEDFVNDIYSILNQPVSLLECWGITPTAGSDKGVINKTSKLYHTCLLFLTEAYSIYSVILSSGRYLDSMSQLYNNDTASNIKEEEELKVKDYKYNISYDAPHCSYEDVKDLISEEYYNEYVKYMNTVVINPILAEKGTVQSKFDSKMLINAYIRKVCEYKNPVYSNRAALGIVVNPIDEKYELKLEYATVVEELEEENDLTATSLLSKLGLLEAVESNEADKPRLIQLLQDVLNVHHITELPLDYLLQTLENKKSNFSFTEEDLHAFYVQIGRDLADDQEAIVFDDNYVKSTDKSSLEAYSDNLFNAKSLYVQRDTTAMRNVLTATKFKSIARQFSLCQTEEEWNNLYAELEKLVNTKLNYSHNMAEAKINPISEKIEDTIGDELLIDIIQSYARLFLPTANDAYIFFTKIDNIILDTISYVSTELDLTKVNSLKHLTVEDVKELNKEIERVTRFNDTAMAVSFLLPTSVLEEAVEQKAQCAERIAKNTPIEETVMDSKRRIKKSIVLFQKYLETGNSDYRSEVDMDVIPFELLTFDNPTESGGIFGPYSKDTLIESFDLKDPGDPVGNSELLKKPYIELFDIIIAQVPNFLTDCPKAIADYIEREHKLDNATVE